MPMPSSTSGLRNVAASACLLPARRRTSLSVAYVNSVMDARSAQAAGEALSDLHGAAPAIGSREAYKAVARLQGKA